MTTERVLVKEASKKITPVPATYGTETSKVEVSPATRAYSVAAGRGSAPASPSNIAAAKAAGINLDAAKVGECFHEHFKPAQYKDCLLYTSPSPRDRQKSRMPSSA